jgi:DNA-binding NtrC family response regulator
MTFFPTPKLNWYPNCIIVEWVTLSSVTEAAYLMKTDYTILVVDDEPVIRESLQIFLEDEGYHCLTAADVAEAKEQLQQHEIHMVITDLLMPGPTGLTLIHHIKSSFENTPVVLITAYTNAELASKALSHGVLSCLYKPVDFEELLTMINRWFGREEASS